MVRESSVPRDWFRKGDSDIRTVELLLDHGGDLEIAASHIQQAIEKYLKGFLLSRGWKLKKTHDLVELMDYAVEYNEELCVFLDMCMEYTAFYFEARYPFFREGPSKKEVEKALIQTKRFVAEILKDFD